MFKNWQSLFKGELPLIFGKIFKKYIESVNKTLATMTNLLISLIRRYVVPTWNSDHFKFPRGDCVCPNGVDGAANRHFQQLPTLFIK